MTGAEAREFAGRLDLNVDDMPICLACLSFVSMSLGDERKARGWAVRMAPDLWLEGLEQPVRLALERARVAGLPRAGEAIANVETRGAEEWLSVKSCCCWPISSTRRRGPIVRKSASSQRFRGLAR